MSGPGYASTSEATGQIYAYATAGGNDEARLYDSSGDDTFLADGKVNGVRLQGGGIDTATMVDSGGDDTFTFDHPGGRFQGLGFDAYAENFEQYFVYASRGGYDRSHLIDTDGDDTLVGRENWYELTTPYETVRGEAFDYAKAFKNKAGTDTLDVDAVNCAFEQEGDWLAPLP